ncbi:MAG: hypothetical protein JWM19_1988, partial [Actinomycetia bacterium]|nr:hypothetical protein [Actinomycetes bacterium]
TAAGTAAAAAMPRFVLMARRFVVPPRPHPRGQARRLLHPGQAGQGRLPGPNIAIAKFPGATQVVDLYHAREHLHSLTRSLEFMLLDRRDEWLAARMGDLDYGYIDGIEAAVRKYPPEGVKKDGAEKELGYFLNNAPACATTGSANAASSPAPASWKPAARRSSTGSRPVARDASAKSARPGFARSGRNSRYMTSFWIMSVSTCVGCTLLTLRSEPQRLATAPAPGD